MKKNLIVLFLALNFCLASFGASDNPEAVKFYNHGIDLYQADDIDASIESFRKATQLDQNFYEAFYNLAQILNSTGKRDEAIDAYTRALTLEPTNYECMYDLAEALYKRGYLMKSVSYLNKIPKTSENYNEAQTLLETVKERQVIVAREIEEKKQAEAQKKAEAQVSKQQLISTIPAVPIIRQAIEFADIKSPSGIAIDTNGIVYIASYGDNMIYKIKDNQKSEFVSQGKLNGPVGLCVDNNNNLYVANYGGGNILRFSQDGSSVVFATVEKPYYISVSNGFLYVTEQKTNKVLKYSL